MTLYIAFDIIHGFP